MIEETKPVCPRCKGTGQRRVMSRSGYRRCSCTPAPEKKRGPRAATHEGECGFCERRFSIGRSDERLALHGFQRPGTGWLIGACPGENKRPVELSTETLELLRAAAAHHAEGAETFAAHLRSGTVAELLFDLRRPGFHSLPRTATHSERFETVTVRPGDKADYIRGLPSFNDLLGQRLRNAEREGRHARELEARAVSRITTWKLAELRSL